MSNPAKGKFSGPGDGNVYAKANEVIVKITGADTNQTFEVVEENCKPGFQSRAHYHMKVRGKNGSRLIPCRTECCPCSKSAGWPLDGLQAGRGA